MTTGFFNDIAPIKFEGLNSTNPLAYRHYNPDEMILGKPMKGHLRFAAAWWHSFAWPGTDPFGGQTFERPWFPADTMALCKLRADVAIAPSDIQIFRGTGPLPDNAMADPRHAALGWRQYGEETGDDGSDWDAIRVAHCIPETGIELIPNTSFILETGFERLNGVDFKKGCYVGQEVVARMKHKTTLRKGLLTVSIKGHAPVGTPITVNGKPVGTIFTQSGGHAIAYLRFDRAKGEMLAGQATVTVTS